jgi:hypothetical protein
MTRVTRAVRLVRPLGRTQSRRLSAGLTEVSDTDRPRNSPAMTGPDAVVINCPNKVCELLLNEYRVVVPLFQWMTAWPDAVPRRLLQASVAGTPPGGVPAVPELIAGFVEMHGPKVALTLSVTVWGVSRSPGL